MDRTLLLVLLGVVACKSEAASSNEAPVVPPVPPQVLYDAAPADASAALAPALDPRGRIGFSTLLAQSDASLAAIRAQLPPDTGRSRAMLAFLDRFAHTAERRKDWLRRLASEGWDDSYTVARLVAELPVGIDGDCAGGGIGAGTPSVQLLPNGTLAGEIESNMTLERYRGRWKADGDQLVIDFRVQVQETGDLGGSGGRSRHKFSDQRVYVLSSGTLINAAGDPCGLRRAESAATR